MAEEEGQPVFHKPGEEADAAYSGAYCNQGYPEALRELGHKAGKGDARADGYDNKEPEAGSCAAKVLSLRQ